MTPTKALALAVLAVLIYATLAATDASLSERLGWTVGWLLLAWALYGMPLPWRVS